MARTFFDRIRCSALSTILIAFSWTGLAEAENNTWYQWRGPSRDGQTKGQIWPGKLGGDHLTKSWRVEMGPSYSGPIVTKDRVFVTETTDKEFETVRAVDRASGKQIWETRWKGSMTVPFFAKSNGSWIRATPAYDGKRLYVAGIRDVLVCLDGEDGKQIWRVDFVKQVKSKLPSFGCVSSPLLMGDFVYVQAGGGFTKLDKLTGKIVWQSLRDGGGMYGSAFSSPFPATIGDTPQIVVQTRKHLTGIDPQSGDVLWKREIPAFRGMNILTPTVVGDSVFTSSYGGRSFLYNAVKQSDSWKVKEAWTNKTQGYMSSPVVIDGHVYLHLKNQRFTCIDLATGIERWTTKPFGKYWSMVASGSRILALDERGELLLIQANPESFELLDRRKVAEDSWAHVAVCGGEVFIRELNALAKYQWK